MNIQIKSASVCDAADGPLRDAGYDEDGDRRYVRAPHAWFIQVTATDGRRYHQTTSIPFRAITAQYNVVLFYQAKRHLAQIDEIERKCWDRVSSMKDAMPSTVDPGLFDRIMAEANGGERIERSEKASWDDEVLLWVGQTTRACKKVSDREDERRSNLRRAAKLKLSSAAAWMSENECMPSGWFWSGEVGLSLLVSEKSLKALESLKARAAELLAAGEIVLDEGWQQSAYSEYGSAAAEEEAWLMEQRHRQEGY